MQCFETAPKLYHRSSISCSLPPWASISKCGRSLQLCPGKQLRPQPQFSPHLQRCTSYRTEPKRNLSTKIEALHGRNLMVAVDSSQDSQYACQWLIDNVYKEGDTIHAVHCIPFFPRSGVYALPDGRIAAVDFDALLRNQDQFLMAAEKAVHDWCSGVLDTAKVRYVVELLREPPGPEDKDAIGETICKKAKELQATVLVVATQSKSGLSEFLMGSVASYCTHRCEAPVLVVHRAQERGQGGGLKSWLPALSSFLTPKVKAELMAAAATSAAPCVKNRDGMEAFANVVELSRKEEGGEGEVKPPAESVIITSADITTDDENIFGQTADFPGIGSQAERSFADSAEAAWHAQQEAEEVRRRQEREQQRLQAQQAQETIGRHIVLAVDDSDESERACRWAAQHLYRPKDTFHIMHVIPALPYRPTYGGPVMDGLIYHVDVPTEDFQKATELYVSKRFVSMLEEMGISPEVEIFTERANDCVEGVGSAICRHVGELEGPSVLVVGSHCRGGLHEFILGSLATYLTHHCTSPVAVLH